MGLILVDSSVWIDLFRNRSTRQTAALERLLANQHPIAAGDIIVAEVLQGARSDREFAWIRRAFADFPILSIGGEAVAIDAAQNYRTLRAKGFTIRKTIDSLIASRCILDRIALLHSDRDFAPFVTHLGLIDAMTLDPGVN